MKLPAPATIQLLVRVAVLIAALAIWVLALLLLMEVTRQLLDTMAFIIDIARMR